jgi:hypothetical protein
MFKTVRTIDFDKLMKVLDDTDEKYVFEKVNLIPREDDQKAELQKLVNYGKMNRKSVLGIDIYKYSSFEEFEQSLIPCLFKMLFTSTIDRCFTEHKFFFQNYTKHEIEENFISTGDGGFVIFDLPMQSLLFACNFATVLRTYNAFHFYPKLRKIIGGISLRYAITYDKLYFFDNNHYGRAIINNARILNKDSLNRCLIDQNTYNWFTVNIDGLENLQILTIDEASNIFDFQGNYDYSVLEEHEDGFFKKEVNRNIGIINSDILKIGEIKSKEANIPVYNLHLQVASIWKAESLSRTLTISLGNLNTSNLE